MQCPGWSLTYTQGWWRQNYCSKVLGESDNSACTTDNPASACSLALLFNEVSSSLQDIANIACAGVVDLTETSTEFDICDCLKKIQVPPKDGGTVPNNEQAPRSNALAFFLNSLLTDTPSQPTTPTDCSDVPYIPAVDTCVVTRPESAEECPCPTGPLSTWNSSADPDCFDFVDNAADNPGQRLPATSAKLPACQMQRCTCEPPEVSATLPTYCGGTVMLWAEQCTDPAPEGLFVPGG